MSKRRREESMTPWWVGGTIVAVLGAGAITTSSLTAERGFPRDISDQLDSLRTRFEEECRERTDQTLYDGSLGRITAQRDAYLTSQRYGGSCERWLCQRVVNPNGTHEYKAVFRPVTAAECD